MAKYLIRIRETAHAAHYAENVIVGGIYAHLSSLGALNCGVRKNKLEGGVVNARKVTCAAGLVFLGPQRKAVHVNTLIGAARVSLVRLDPREVGSFALREAVLAVKLELSGNNGVLAPAVHVEGRLGEDEGAGIRDGRLLAKSIVNINNRAKTGL